MRKGWIQTDTDSVYEDFAPKSTADLIYMDDTKTLTVKQELENRLGQNPTFNTVTANCVIGAVYQ